MGIYRYSKLGSFFFADSAGHKYVQSLAFVKREVTRPGSEEERQALRTVKLALQLLPRDNLKIFSTPRGLDLDEDTLQLLLTQQKKLESLSIGGQLEDRPKKALKAKWRPREALGALRKLVIPTSHDEALECAGYTRPVRRSKQLETLIFTSKSGLRERSPDGPEADREVKAEKFIRVLFSQTSALEQCKPCLKLSRVRFHNADFLSTADRLTAAIDFAKLTALEIDECLDDEPLLDSIVSVFEAKVSALKHFAYAGTMFVPGAIPKLLEACPPLSTLRLLDQSAIDTSWDELSFLDKHLPALVALRLSLQYPAEEGLFDVMVDLPHDELERISKRSTGLTELAVSLPNVPLSGCTCADHVDFRRMLVSICQLPRLRCLRILNWPNFKTLPRQVSHRKNHMMQSLDGAARHLLAQIGHLREGAGLGKLMALAFGSTTYEDFVIDQSTSTDVALGTVCYVQGSITDVYGGTCKTAVRITPKQLEEKGESFCVMEDAVRRPPWD